MNINTIYISICLENKDIDKKNKNKNKQIIFNGEIYENNP